MFKNSKFNIKVNFYRSEAEILSQLKLSGWIGTQFLPVEITEAENDDIKKSLKSATDFKVVEVVSVKPNFEVDTTHLCFSVFITISVIYHPSR